jgi:hydroxymethylbilane synthase
MLPAAGQGALGIEIRADDDRFRALVTSVNHSPSWTAVAAERGFMARLGAGCRVPAAAYAVVENEQVWLRALVASPEGEVIVRGERRGPADQAKALGHALAEELLAEGAAELLGSN